MIRLTRRELSFGIILIVLNLGINEKLIAQVSFLKGNKPEDYTVLSENVANERLLHQISQIRRHIEAEENVSIRPPLRKLHLNEMRIGLDILASVGLGPILKIEASPGFFLTIKKKARGI